MQHTMKVTLKLVLLLALPAALIDALNGVYNVYVPIYLQAGGGAFDTTGAALTFGFGVGAALVGLWMTADNIAGFFFTPLIAAWSDRTRTRFGRRLPYILFTVPFLVVGYALIPVIPTLIPAELNGQQARLVGLFLMFTASCIIFYLGFLPQRVILQTLRQEMVDLKDRSKIEAWYTFLMYFISIFAYAFGGGLYKIYGPLLFWIGLGVYGISITALLVFFREPQSLVEMAGQQEDNNLKQLLSVFKGRPRRESANLILFLASIVFFVLSSSGLGNFASSWMVNVLKVDEARAGVLVAVYTIGATLASIPAGMIASSKFGRHRLYLAGLAITLAAAVLMVFLPQLYVVGLALYGIGLGTALVTMLPLATELINADGRMGSTVGVYNIAYTFGFLIGANLFGWVIQVTSYDSFFITAAVVIFIALVLALGVREPGALPRPASQPLASD